jgi:hypothetical protein
MSIDHILTTLRGTLPITARALIVSGRDPDTLDPLEKTFSESPDNPAEHSPMWHQYGILTHSEEFRKFIAVDAPVLLEQWDISKEATTTLSQEIDGIPKADLLQAASLLHDLGKFTARTFERQEDGSLLARFTNHEANSGAIVRSAFKDILKEQGLTDAQIEYIAQCTEHHFELGKIRKAAAENGGYTMAFAKSDAFKSAAQKILNKNPHLALEIGLMFIADSLSKTEIAATTGTDEEIESQRSKLEQEIKDKGLDPRLINQALQQPVNIEMGRQFLQLWAASVTATSFRN